MLYARLLPCVSVLVAAFLTAPVYSTVPDEAAVPQCQGRTTISQSYIGKDNNVKVELLQCSDLVVPEVVAPVTFSGLEKRQVNVCGAECDTNCFVPAGGGPDPNECHVIADALLYDSQNIGALFTLDPAANTSVITMTYRSCSTFMVNQDNVALTYCRTDWSAVLDFVAQNCQATQNAHGGNCVASDQTWFIQVQHS